MRLDCQILLKSPPPLPNYASWIRTWIEHIKYDKVFLPRTSSCWVHTYLQSPSIHLRRVCRSFCGRKINVWNAFSCQKHFVKCCCFCFSRAFLFEPPWCLRWKVTSQRSTTSFSLDLFPSNKLSNPCLAKPFAKFLFRINICSYHQNLWLVTSEENVWSLR